MCTVTWWYADDGYDVFFNRDELKTRLAEIEPRAQSLAGVRFVAPADADAGGTWLLVNEFWLTVGVLNQYPQHVRSPRGPRVSRGQLVRSLGSCRSVEAFQACLAATDLTHFMPFKLFAVGVGGACVMGWDSHHLTQLHAAEEPLPLTSSSYQTALVEPARKHLFLDALLTGDKPYGPAFLQAFHRISFAGEDGAYGVCMEREDARTVSFSHICVRHADAALFNYQRRSAAHGGFERNMSVRLELASHV